uniref:Dynactin domain-containing protein n=1 Tax=Steinernema glaseri TaxID=37863 RepID=A0A1I7YIA9_9BILA
MELEEENESMRSKLEMTLQSMERDEDALMAKQTMEEEVRMLLAEVEEINQILATQIQHEQEFRKKLTLYADNLHIAEVGKDADLKQIHEMEEALQMSAADTSSELAAKDLEISNLRDNLQDLKVIAALESTETASKISDLEKAIFAAEDEAQAQAAEKNSLEEQLKKMTIENAAIMRENVQLDLQISELDEQLENTEALRTQEREARNCEREQSERQQAQLAQKVQEMDNEIETLREELAKKEVPEGYMKKPQNAIEMLQFIKEYQNYLKQGM